MAKEKSYDQAYEELQNLVSSIQSEETGLDKMEAQVKKATELIQYCQSKLRSLENEINIIFQKEE